VTGPSSVNRITPGDSKFEWLVTARQSVPRLLSLVRQLEPTWHMADVRGIGPEFLEEYAIRTVLWDVDGTLTPHHGVEVAAPLRAAFERVLEVSTVRHALLSNCGEARFLELGRIFPGLQVLQAYETSGTVVLRSSFEGRQRWTDPGLATVTPEGLKKLKKPSALLIQAVLSHLGVEDRAQALMVGDQYLTDIAGANLAGIRSIKVNTYQPGSFPLALRVFQQVERALYVAGHGREALA
jgi:predicted HAD superfamily phosphohydrolase YqeG